VRVEVGVAQVFDVFSEVTEEENVLLADFAGDFDLSDVSFKVVKVKYMYDLRSHHRRYR
jgi:hypothetical protein